MTTLLDSSTATSAAAQEGHVKTFLANLRTFIADLLGTDSANKGAVLSALAAPLNGTAVKTTAYTVVAADRGKVLVFTGAGGLTISLAPAATLGDGFSFGIINNTSGALAVDPNLSETINGATSYVIQPTETVIPFCDGVKFGLFGKAPAIMVTTLNGLSGAISAAQVAAAAASGWGYTPTNPASVPPMTAFVAATSYEYATSGTHTSGTKVLFVRANGSTFELVTEFSRYVDGGG